VIAVDDPAGELAARAAGGGGQVGSLPGVDRPAGLTGTPSSASSATRANRAFGGTTSSTAAAALRRTLTSFSSSVIRSRRLSTRPIRPALASGTSARGRRGLATSIGAGTIPRCPTSPRPPGPNAPRRPNPRHGGGTPADKASAATSASFRQSSNRSRSTAVSGKQGATSPVSTRNGGCRGGDDPKRATGRVCVARHR
jgi:hypothetical protein